MDPLSITGLFRKKGMMYTAYAVGCVVFFIWYLFPSEFFADYIEKTLKSATGTIEVSIGSVKPSFPPGIKVSDIRVTLPDTDGRKYSAEYLKVSPGLTSLLKLDPVLNFSAGFLGGVVKGSVKIPGGKPDKLSLEMMKIKGVNLELLSGVLSAYAPGYSIRGTLDAVGNYSSEGRGNGKVSVNVNDLVVTPEKPLFTIESLNFKEIIADVEIKNKKLQIEKCEIDGLEADGEVKGSVFIRTPLERSTLRINGTVTPEKTFMDKLSETMPVEALLGKKMDRDNGIPFKISGSLSSPKFSMK